MEALAYIYFVAILIAVLAWCGGFFLLVRFGSWSFGGAVGIVLMLPVLIITLKSIWQYFSS